MAFLISLAVFVLLVLLISFFSYRTCFYSSKEHRNTPDDPMEGEQYEAVSENIYRISHVMEKIPFEAVSIKSHDGLNLYGRYYHLKDGAPLKILFHGYRSHAYRDCSGGHALARKMGFNTLVVDQRAHGKSDGNTISFGIKERYDVLSWIKYSNKRFGEQIPIILSGLSMGAATILMASGLDLPNNVTCIMADSPFSAPIAIIEKVCADRHYPVALFRPFIHLGARIYGRFNLSETTAKEAVSHAKVPILLVHGEADHYVPCPMSLEIASCCASPVTVHTFPGAGHGLSYMVDPLRYERVAYQFLRQFPQIERHISKSFLEQLNS